MGWFASWGDGKPAGGWPAFDASSESRGKAAGILRWFARGGTHINQYNWAGGNHFARNAGSSMVNSYYWDAPIASDLLAQGAERRHIARAFAALALPAVAPVLLAAPAQLHRQTMPRYYDAAGAHAGDAQHIAFVYAAPAGHDDDVLFFENRNGQSVAAFEWRGRNYSVSGGGVALALGSGALLFDSNDVEPLAAARAWAPVPGALGAWQAWADALVPATPAALPAPTPRRAPWVGSALGAVVVAPAPLEAVAFSEYDSELVLYATTVSAADVAAAVAASPDGAAAVPLTLASAAAQGWAAFADGALVGTVDELSHGQGTASLTMRLNLSRAAGAGGPLVLALLSSSLGIGNGAGVSNGTSSGVKGITSAAPRSVLLGKDGAGAHAVDLTTAAPWAHVCGASGEARGAFTPAGGAALPWAPAGAGAAPPLTWLRTTFTAPAAAFVTPGIEANATLNLDASGLSRGRFWVNGFDLGRYWTRLCGATFMCQRFYSIPFDLLLPGAGANSLVLLDELGAPDVSAVALALSSNVPLPACKAPAGAAPAGTFPCGSAGTALTAAPRAGGGTAYALGGACLTGSTTAAAVFAACDAANASQAWVRAPGAAALTTVAHGASLCLDITGQNASVGAALGLYRCNGGQDQAFAADARGELASALTNGALCVGACVY